MFTSSVVIGLVPGRKLRRWLNHNAMMITFRLLARGYSAVITVHNKENIPKRNGICVANHTTPVDIVILATNNSFSLVPLPNNNFFALALLCMPWGYIFYDMYAT
jgi:glycerol-3-phosphate O-acyltransferase 3/4